MKVVYLVATLDATQKPPCVIGVSLVGEPWAKMTLPHSAERCYVNLWEAKGVDWDDAVANLRDEIAGPRGYPGMHWALAWIDRDRAKGTR